VQITIDINGKSNYYTETILHQVSLLER